MKEWKSLLFCWLLISPSLALAQSGPFWKPLGPAPILNGGTGTGGLSPITVTGRITAIAAHPTDPNTIYIGAAGGGVWKTTNGGASWVPLTDNQASTAIGALALAPANPNIVYAGTGESDHGSGDLYGRGLLKSMDGGATWTLLTGNGGVNEFNRRNIVKVVVDPTDSNTVYLTIVPTNVALGGSTGVWKSTDGGVSWTNTTATPLGDATDGYTDLVMDPTNHQVLYTAIGNIQGGAKNGVYKTNDGGSTWTLAGDIVTATGQPATNFSRITLAIAPSHPQTVYAGIAGTNAFNGLALLAMMKTTNGGANWSQLTGTPNYLHGQGDFDTTLGVNPSDPNNVFAGGETGGGTNGIIESTDGGTTWFDINPGVDGNGVHTDHHSMGFDANGKLLDGNDGGLWRLENAAKAALHWSNLNSNLSITQFWGIALDPINPNIAYGGSQDNGLEKFTGAPAWTQTLYTDGGYMRVDFNNPQTVYAWSNRLSMVRSDDAGMTWNAKNNGINLNDTIKFIPPLVIDPANSSRLLVGTDHVYETTNKAESWTAIGIPGTAGFGLSSNSPGLDSLAVSGNTVYASGGGHVWVTTNDGTSWTQRDISGISTTIKDMAINLASPVEAYAVISAFGGGKVFRTTTSGATWTNITGNLPNVPANAIKRHPVTGALYVGTDEGVFVSVDLGVSWYSLGSGLPTTVVSDLDLEPQLGLLGAGTHGRGLWEIPVNGTDWQAVDLTTSGDGKARLLWDNIDGRINIWSIDNSGVPTYGPAYGPYSGFTARSIASGADSLTRVLWNKSDGTAVLWLVGQSGSYNNALETSFGFGPYPGWTAIDIAVGSDNRTRILWANVDGTVIIWTVDNAGHATYGPVYGPYPGYTAAALSAGSFTGADPYTRLLWRRTDGAATLWFLDSGNNYLASYGYGPYPGWMPLDIAVNNDNKARILWGNVNGQMITWTIDNAGAATYGSAYGPYSGYFVDRISAGSDGLIRLLWNKVDGTAALWLTSSNNLYQTSYAFGPY